MLHELQDRYERDVDSYRKDISHLRIEVDRITRKYEELMKFNLRKKMDSGDYNFSQDEKQFLRQAMDWTED